LWLSWLLFFILFLQRTLLKHRSLLQKQVLLIFVSTKKFQQKADFLIERGLWMNLDGERVIGEYQNIPAEKDSKVGIFQGTVGAVDPTSMARTADPLVGSKS
jgi:hypothetical protein